jgi:hypothetical protein
LRRLRRSLLVEEVAPSLLVEEVALATVSKPGDRDVGGPLARFRDRR